MARYTGPKSRIARKFGEGIFGADKVLSKKNYPPGQHGNNRRRKTSEYGVMLAEKQKAKYTYGVLEKQFRNLFEKAESAAGITGEILLQSLEARLDNVVFRLGIAPTRAAARQLVGHKHITVDGKVVNIPSYAVKPGQIVGVRERSKSLEVIANREVVKELVADTMTVGNMQSELKKLIEDQEYKDRMLAEYEYMADRLGPAGAPQHAARKMLELLKK